MHRRSILKGLIGAPFLSAPSVMAQNARVLKFVPQADLAVADPIFGISFVTRNHAHLVFDYLYAQDSEGRLHPQMAEGHLREEDGRLWTIRLREGLRFHDGSPVLARDVVASLKRWSTRQAFAISVFQDVEELAAPDDRTVRFRFKRPFQLLPELLGRPLPFPPAIMPERLAASTPATQAVSEIVGSGPYRFVAGERVPGARAVYQRFEGYVPRPGGEASGTAGPKIVNFDRVEWLTMPDAATASAALQTGEVDWWEQASNDLIPVLRGRRDVAVDVLDTSGFMAVMRFNHLASPFDRPEIRRAFLGAFDQTDFMTGVVGTDPTFKKVDVGYFAPNSPNASRAGLEALNRRSDAAIRADLQAAGYNGELVRLIGPVDLAPLNAMSQIAADVFRRLGVNLDHVSIDWGAALARLNSRNPVAEGGWSVTPNYTAGFITDDPTAHGFLRGIGTQAVFGWPTSPEIERLRSAWMDTNDEAQRRRFAEDIQKQALRDVPYVPLGGFTLASAYRRNLTGMLKGAVPVFWNVRRS